jgi:hypothetical protein
MTMANACRIYCMLVMERPPDCQCLLMKEAIKELMFSLMQRGSPMRMREASHPRPNIDLSRILGSTCGNKVRFRCKETSGGRRGILPRDMD